MWCNSSLWGVFNYTKILLDNQAQIIHNLESANELLLIMAVYMSDVLVNQYLNTVVDSSLKCG